MGGGNHKVIEEWHSKSGGQWWRKWSDGYLEQGGLWNEAGPAEGYTDRTITLPVSFGTVNYVVVVQSGFRDNSGLGTYVSEKDTSFLKQKVHLIHRMLLHGTRVDIEERNGRSESISFESLK